MMKRLISVFLVLTLCFTMSACGKKDDVKKENKETYDAKALVEEAVSNMEKESVKSMTVKTVNTYDNGLEDTEDCTYIYNKEKNMIESKTLDDYGEEIYLHSFYVKENDVYKVYINDAYNGSGWVSYKEELEDDEVSEFDTISSDFSVCINEENGFSDIEYSYEGEEVLDDMNTLKVKVSAKEILDSGIEDVVQITRQDILEQYGWTEEEINAVEGFSEILDNYVKASNDTAGESMMDTVFTMWIGEKDHQMIRIRKEQNIESAQNDTAKKASTEFEENFWKMDMLHYNIKENGKTIEEAKKIVEDSMNGVVSDNATEDSSSEEVNDETVLQQYEELVKTVVTKRFKVGEDCPVMGELPESYEEMTMDEYYSTGFEEYFE